MTLHILKIRPVALFGKLAAALLFLPLASTAQDPAAGTVAGRATIQLKNASYRSDLGGMDLVLAPTNLIPEIRRLRMETWRTDGLSVTRSAEGEENPVGVRIDFADGYKNLDLKALGQAAADAATHRTKSSTNGEFSFANVSPGKYALYGQYKSRFAVAYWLMEVPVSKGQTNCLELTETNAAEVFNRFEKTAP
ncbi:MAG: hypothetical protein FJ411_05945 [Verrucomicrobia bacterium]|nr:hypothetical protein [Verrucomicrobiota bacterium]